MLVCHPLMCGDFISDLEHISIWSIYFEIFPSELEDLLMCLYKHCLELVFTLNVC